VSLTEHDSATVTLTRNRHLVEMARISRSALNLPAVPAEDRASDDGHAQLLTASAARVLFALAERHPRLQRGLRGAKRWESSALHVLAVEGPYTKDKARQKQLLAAAVDFDHGNALARVAYLHCFGRRGDDAEDQLRFVKLISDLYNQVFPTGAAQDGFEALELRVLYSRVAANLNAELLLRSSKAAGKRAAALQAWQDAGDCAQQLISKLERDHPHDEQLQRFIDEVRPSTHYLWRSIDDRAGFWLSDLNHRDLAEWLRTRAEAEDTVAGWEPGKQPGPPTPLSSGIYYDRACWNAERCDLSDEQKQSALQGAIDDLREAVTDEGLREWARLDPSLRIFRDPDTKYELRQRYKEIVGGAARRTSFSRFRLTCATPKGCAPSGSRRPSS
jgi:hypothetical protein